MYSQHFSTRKTSQTQPIPGSDQVKNSAGGYSFEITDWDMLGRFLILGSEGGSYYTSEREMTITNAQAVQRCIKQDGRRVVDYVLDVSVNGKAPKNDAALFVLAMCAGIGDLDTRKKALDSLSSVARTGTHLFTFVEYVKAFRGWGRLLREAIAKWYQDKPLEKLAYQVAKYQRRGGWSHRDVLRLCKPKPSTNTESAIYAWATKGTISEATPELLIAMNEVNTASPKEAIDMIVNHGLTREMIPTELLGRADVWEALLDKMPLTAMVRNLGNLSKVGLLKSMSDTSTLVCDRLRDREWIHRARVHPIQMLMANTTYSQGHGVRGNGSWDVVSAVVDALDDAFYLAFQNTEPTNKRTLLALDVSGSMTWGSVSGCVGLTPRDASAAMALVTARTEPNHEIMSFSHRLSPVNITAKSTLRDAIKNVSNLPFGGTDCSLPMVWALKSGVDVDTFIIYTDNETWAGKMHPKQALEQYRQKTGINAKLIVCAMEANRFSIADPHDPGMLDVVGFDANVPRVISEFAK